MKIRVTLITCKIAIYFKASIESMPTFVSGDFGSRPRFLPISVSSKSGLLVLLDESLLFLCTEFFNSYLYLYLYLYLYDTILKFSKEKNKVSVSLTEIFAIQCCISIEQYSPIRSHFIANCSANNS